MDRSIVIEKLKSNKSSCLNIINIFLSFLFVSFQPLFSSFNCMGHPRGSGGGGSGGLERASSYLICYLFGSGLHNWSFFLLID